jgi:DNA-3-methyladenine glycosylase
MLHCMHIAPLPRRFFERDAARVARALVGCLLVRRRETELCVCRIVETEAYLGEHDLASHSRVGRTPRNASMFGPRGHAYVFQVYGMHYCMNAVCGGGGEAAAVLLRAAAPVERIGPDLSPTGAAICAPRSSTAGPGRLCSALGIDRALDGADLCRSDGALWLAPRAGRPPRIEVGPRVGVAYAGEWATAPLRFWEAGSPFVSRGR